MIVASYLTAGVVNKTKIPTAYKCRCMCGLNENRPNHVNDGQSKIIECD